MANMIGLQPDQDIPDSNHVMRYCSPKHVQDGEIAESAFSLKKNDSQLSVNWLEYFNGNSTFSDCLDALMSSVGQSITLKPNGRFAKINVGIAKSAIKNIQIKYEPVHPRNLSHAGIYLPPEENREQTLELASIVGSHETFPAVSE